jgi:ADP-ribose pyrophosphatase YjhB (NUDIX family)
MEKYHGNTVEYWKQNAEENYLTTPISVLKYITVLEEQAEQLRKHAVSKSFTAEQVVNELEDCDTLDDAIMFFKERM